MNRKDAQSVAENYLAERRLLHTLGVAATAVSLARRWDADEEKTVVAALLHDIAKELPLEQQEALARLDSPPPDEDIWRIPKLLHAPAGAVLAARHGEKDPLILEAIRLHTIGAPAMNKEAMIVYLADYLEPGRVFPGVDELRALAVKDLNLCMVRSLQSVMHYLGENGKAVHPQAELALEYYQKLIGEQAQEKRAAE